MTFAVASGNLLGSEARMTEKAEQLLEQLKQLPGAELQLVLARLLGDLDEDAQPVDPAWAAELERRHDDIVAGRTVGMPLDQALADIRSKYQRR